MKPKHDNLTLCKRCNCMTKTIKGKCGKCKYGGKCNCNYDKRKERKGFKWI